MIASRYTDQNQSACNSSGRTSMAWLRSMSGLNIAKLSKTSTSALLQVLMRSPLVTQFAEPEHVQFKCEDVDGWLRSMSGHNIATRTALDIRVDHSSPMSAWVCNSSIIRPIGSQSSRHLIHYFPCLELSTSYPSYVSKSYSTAFQYFLYGSSLISAITITLVCFVPHTWCDNSDIYWKTNLTFSYKLYLYIDGSYGEHLAQYGEPCELSVSAQFISQYSSNETIWSIT